MTLQGKAAIVTGSNRGIGRAIARALAAEGASCVLCARDEHKLASVEREIRDAGGEAASLVTRSPSAGCTVDSSSTSRSPDTAASTSSSTARGPPSAERFSILSDDDFVDGFALKYFAAVRLLKAAWPWLQKTGGSVVNIAGVGGRTPGEMFAIGGSVNAAHAVADQIACRSRFERRHSSQRRQPGAIRTERLRSASRRSPNPATCHSPTPSVHSSNRTGHANRRTRRHRESHRLHGERARAVPARRSRRYGRRRNENDLAEKDPAKQGADHRHRQPPDEQAVEERLHIGAGRRAGDEERADGGERRQIHQAGADVHRPRDVRADRCRRAAAPARAPSAETPAARRRTCCCRPTPDRCRMRRSARPSAASTRARCRSRSTRAPCVSCIIEMSTVTPVTIRMTPHGIRWIACASFTARSRMSAVAMMSPIIPTFIPSPATVSNEHDDAGGGQPVACLHRAGWLVLGRAPLRRGAETSASRRAARKPPKPTSVCARAL